MLAASNVWSWVPEGAPHIETDEYLVVAYPHYFIQPTAARVFGSERDAAELVDEVEAVARGWERARLWWRLHDRTRPRRLEDELLARGAVVTERMDVLALPLYAAVPDLGAPADVVVRRVTDEQTLRDVYVVSQDAFGGEEPTEEQIASGLAETAQSAADGSGGRFVAYLDGSPAGTGGFSLVGGVCRLWGGGTHSAFRRRGAYRAVLQARLTAARDAGATLALTHGVVDTSSPILRRIGFSRYGEERTLVIDVPTS